MIKLVAYLSAACSKTLLSCNANTKNAKLIEENETVKTTTNNMGDNRYLLPTLRIEFGRFKILVLDV